MKISQHSKTTLFIGLALASSCATAATDSVFDFSLDFEQQDIDLRGDSKLEQEAIGFRYSEYAPWPLRFDLLAGWTDTKHEADPQALGHDPVGYYVGLGVGAQTDPRRRLQAGLELSYRYFAVKSEIDATETDPKDQLDLDWTQAEAKLWLGGRASERLTIYACYYSLQLDGEQALESQPTADQDLKTKTVTGPCAGLRYGMRDNGYIGLELNDGAQQGGHLYFGKLFGR